MQSQQPHLRHFNLRTGIKEACSFSVSCTHIPADWPHTFGIPQDLGHVLGIPILRHRSIFTVLKDAYLHIHGMLQCMCDGGKEASKALPAAQLYRWQNAVTTTDACWLMRSHFSQNCAFMIKNYLSIPFCSMDMCACVSMTMSSRSHCTLIHRSGQRVSWLGKSSSRHVMRVAKCLSPGWMEFVIGKVYPSSFSSTQIMHCAGHVGCAHSHQLNDMKTKKTFMKSFKDKHVKKHPAITSVAAAQRKSTEQDVAVL